MMGLYWVRGSWSICVVISVGSRKLARCGRVRASQHGMVITGSAMRTSARYILLVVHQKSNVKTGLLLL